MLVFFAKTKVQKILGRRRQRNKNIKFYLIMKVRMVRDRDAVSNATGEEVEGSDERETTPHFRSKTMTVLADEDLEGSLHSCFQHMSSAYSSTGDLTGHWICSRCGSVIQGIRSVMDVQNEDQRSLMWSGQLSILTPHHPEVS